MLHISQAVSVVRERTDAKKVRTVGASIIARPPLDDEDIATVEGSREVAGRKLVHRPEQSDDDRTWFDLKKR